MNRKDFNELMERLKEYAQANPAGYRKRVALLGALGYAYIFFILALLALLVIGTIWAMMHANSGRAGLAKLVFFLGVLTFLIVKSLRVKIEAPSGLKITRKDAPGLFDIIEEIRSQQKSVVPDEVLLNNDFNAFIAQVPRLGFLGWYKNYLVLGLPYMLSCTTQHFKAVLAHEFGHFAGSHGRITTWVYRIRVSWHTMFENMEQKSQAGSLLFRRFFNWYVPYFNAYSFVLAREQEYEADRFACAYAGVQANAEELVNATIKGQSTGAYWDNVWSRVNHDPKPPRHVFTEIVPSLKRRVPREEYAGYMKKALKIRTRNDDTHPGLADRLHALGYQVKDGEIVDHRGEALVLQRNIERSAGEELLGDRCAEEVLNRFDQEWFEQIRENWMQRHTEVMKWKEELQVYDRKISDGTITEEERQARAYIIDQTGTREEAMRAINELLTHSPDHAPAHYRLGELLLERNDDTGVDHLKKAVALNAGYKSSVLEKIGWYHESRGEYEHVEDVHEHLDEAVEEDQLAYRERNTITGADTFKEHGLNEAIIDDIKQQLTACEKELKSVYLVQKVLSVYPEDPLYVLAVRGRSKGFHWSPADFNKRLLNKLLEQVDLNADGSLCISVGDASVIKKVKKIPQALIYGDK